MSLGVGAYWHPYDLPYFITLRDISEYTEAQVTAPVLSATGVGVGSEYILRAVFSETRALLLSGDWQVIALLEFTGVGFHAGEWQVIPEAAKGAEVYIALILETQIAADDLALGESELRCR